MQQNQPPREFSADEGRCPEPGSLSGDNRTHVPQKSEWLALNAVEKGYKLVAMTTQQDVHICDVCGAEMLEIHCKLICPRCGFTRDCSDP